MRRPVTANDHPTPRPTGLSALQWSGGLKIRIGFGAHVSKMHFGRKHIIEYRFGVSGRDSDHAKSEIDHIHVTAPTEMPTFAYCGG